MSGDIWPWTLEHEEKQSWYLWTDQKLMAGEVMDPRRELTIAVKKQTNKQHSNLSIYVYTHWQRLFSSLAKKTSLYHKQQWL